MTESKICTCPSGDGSLRWPCPKHPAVEQAGGDERAAFNRWIAEQQLCQGSDISLFKLERNGALVSLHELLRDAYQAGQDRAALAQPSPAQAEAERPGVVARVDGTDEDWFIQPEDETEMHNEGLLFSGCELGRMIDFDRIVGELRADRDSWAEQAEQRLADWDEMRKERDAALVRVEQQERTIAGMNEAHATLAGLYEAAQAQHSVPGDIMRDAQRYRWLRDQQFYFSFSTENSDAGISSCTAGMSSRFKNLSWVDAAIDSAIAAAPGKEGV
ncbi:hypothetical protein RVS53_000412 [Pseudomonas aeruginosa]|nr:hypothetical protein [Pseudomonas aeruginosa]